MVNNSEISVYQYVGLENQESDYVTLVPFDMNSRDFTDNNDALPDNDALLDNDALPDNSENVELESPNSSTIDEIDVDKSELNLPKKSIDEKGGHDDELNEDRISITQPIKEYDYKPSERQTILSKFKRKIKKIGSYKIKSAITFLDFLLEKTDFLVKIEGEFILLNSIKIKLNIFVRFFYKSFKVKKTEFSKLTLFYNSLPKNARRMLTKPKLLNS